MYKGDGKIVRNRGRVINTKRGGGTHKKKNKKTDDRRDRETARQKAGKRER